MSSDRGPGADRFPQAEGSGQKKPVRAIPYRIALRPGLGIPSLRECLALLGAAALLAQPSSARAQGEKAAIEADPIDDARTGDTETGDGEKGVAEKDVDLLIAPVPFSSPATGTGIAGGVAAFYNPNNSPQQWISAAGIVLTNRGARGVAALHTMYLNGDRVRIDAVGLYADSVLDYYGIGDSAGDRGDVLNIDNRHFDMRATALLRVAPELFAGLRYQLMINDGHPQEDTESATVPPPAEELAGTSSMLGPVLVYDTRDSHTQPRKGNYVVATWLIGSRTLGDSFNHNKFTLEANTYIPVGSTTTLALRGSMCTTGGNVPYYDLCLFGSKADLRGYATGRYRDSASWATQAELRHRLTERWGMVVFGGVGGIAPSAGRLFDDGNLLPAGGIGARYLPFKDNDVQLRVDVAIGSAGEGIYLGFGEAF